MTHLLAHALQTAEGVVVEIGADGVATVDADDGASWPCRLLETSAGPPLRLASGDRVLVAVLADDGPAFVLGRIGLCTSTQTPGREAPRLDETSAGAHAGRTVEIVMPDGVETVRIAGTRVRIAADEELTLECGGASVRINRRGKVVVLGTDVTTRARRLHKIKGARVAIN